MNETRILRTHYWIRALLLFGLAIYIVFLVKTDHIVYYIAPRMVGYVKLSALALTIIAVVQVYFAISTSKEKQLQCECGHVQPGTRFKHGTVYGLFLFLLIIGFLTPDALMGSAAAAQKGIKLNNTLSLNQTIGMAAVQDPKTAAASNDNKESDKLQKMFRSGQFDKSFVQTGIKLYKQDTIQVKETGFIETLSIINTYKDNFVGKKIELTGFVYKEDKMKENQFIAARFQVSCCSADANPFGMMVEFDHAKNFAKDSWVKVTGLVGQTNYLGSQITKIYATKVEKLSVPESPYVYPDYEFYKQTN